MINMKPVGDRWYFALYCSIPGCREAITGTEPSVDDCHATIEEQPWMRGVDLGESHRNVDLCPEHARNFKAGGRAALKELDE